MEGFIVTPDIVSAVTVLHALRSATSALRRNPVIVGVMFVVVLLQIPLQLAPLADPMLSSVVSLGITAASVFVVPFVLGGLLGMADEALVGTTSLSTFLEEGKHNYVSLFGAYLLILGASFVFGIVIAIGTVFAVLVALGVGGSATLASVGIVAVVVVLLLFVPLLFVQFYGQAIVLDGEGAIGGFRRSIGVVRRNLVSVFGYTVLVFGVSIVFGLLASVPVFLFRGQQTELYASMLPEVSTGVLVGLLALGVVVSSVLSGLFLTFSVAFYRRISGSSGRGDEPTAESSPA